MDYTENCLNYNSPSSIKAFLDAHGLSAQKRFGQHFLINEGARDKLVEALDVHAGDAVWEIGPGLGAMTRLLLDRGARVTVFEIDRGFVGALHILFAKEIAEKRLTIVAGDALKTWPECSAQAGNTPLSLLGNLPYNIAGTLLGDFIEKGRLFSRAAVTVQKEVARRITARSGDKDYSSLAVLFALAYETRNICPMKGSFFYPPPNVDSAALCFYPKSPLKDSHSRGEVAATFVADPSLLPAACAYGHTLPPSAGQNHAVHDFVGVPKASMDGRITEYAPDGNPKQDVEGCRPAPRNAPLPNHSGGEHPHQNKADVPPIFFPLVRALFARRRKTVYNNLCCFAAENAGFGLPGESRAALCETVLSRCGIAKNARAENLSANDFRSVAECLTDYEHKGQC
ncbi:MAG: 16S rRNA (adenine(1518)-N(6)/adenine(1519)-N(6))-dimethyltransferase RsmA [Spirochaetaceae bacterium]|jgi:16S rRNA (adenine1518-N6/adenine1519-N6)-dimethyltransferase|nr:16S rRNA (adenine(1518)-N(6)/adenine(1519)-N(6))-dimethyltransferase RsmA [Spirochaetaceae bacterium]